jgi:hypothetical protein
VPEIRPTREGDMALTHHNVRLGAVVVVVLLGIVGFSLLRSGGPKEAPELSGPLRAALEQQGCTVDSQADPGREHVTEARYSVNPPAGGNHNAVPSPAGFYELANAPGDAHLVHALEHGFVVVWYRPDGVNPGTVDGLRELARSHPWVVVVPRPTLPSALAATAWHRRLLCPGGPADPLGADGPIGNFVTAFRNQGPEKGFV